MMKILCAVILAVSLMMFSTGSVAQCMLDLKQEAGAKYKRADNEMNRIYTMAGEACDNAGKERLKNAQLAWIKYRDLCCAAEASIYEGGSMYGLAYTNCMTELTKERTGRLKIYDVENKWK